MLDGMIDLVLKDKLVFFAIRIFFIAPQAAKIARKSFDESFNNFQLASIQVKLKELEG